ncbi:MAG: EAL domain-containing protein [Proteobacteria bacterium]|nr:EAL domain-containing protein [Pseudomonadota bacterium]
MNDAYQPSVSVLVVEDDPGDFGLIRAHLRRARLGRSNDKDAAIWAKTLAEGIALARRETPDVVLLDLALPDSSGLATVRAMRAALPDVPVVVLTGHDDDQQALAALHAGAQDYLIKGQFDHDALGRAVRHALVRERLESRLRLFEVALNSAANGIVITDTEARIEWANPAFTQLTGYALDEALGRNPGELIKSGRQDQAFYQELWRTIQSGQVWRGEIVNRHKDGMLYDESLVIAPVIDGGGTIRHFVAILRDITERKRTELELQIAATAFESQEGMFVTDAGNAILRVNRAFAEITGYTAAEAVGKTPALLDSGRHDAAFHAEMLEEIRRNGTWRGEIWHRRKNGEVHPEWLTVTAVRNGSGEVSRYVGTLTDITARKAAEDEIRHLAFYDPLTLLPNRRLLLDRLQQALAVSARSKRLGALLFLDLDNFKTLNDTLGHDKGDLLLQQIAQRLATCVREGDTVARLGGDEFVVMLENLSLSPADAATQTEIVGEKILAALSQPYALAGHEYHSTSSIGVTLFSDQRETVEDLLKRADLAMYQAKTAGRNTLRFFDPEMQASVTARVALEAGLREALRTGQFALHYQAQVDSEGRAKGVEALVRWQHPHRGLLVPAEFVPLAEDTGLILGLGEWIMQRACAQLAAWAGRAETNHLTLAVNVSVRQFRHPGFVKVVRSALARSGADPRKLKLELTESLLANDLKDTIAKMTELKATGVGFSLDDFGTGHASLSYLKRLPFDELKIDQSFVRDALTDQGDATIARTIVALGQSLGLSVIAEGVETETQRKFLAGNGCDAFQGHLFGRPLPLAAFERLLPQPRDSSFSG